MFRTVKLNKRFRCKVCGEHMTRAVKCVECSMYVCPSCCVTETHCKNCFPKTHYSKIRQEYEESKNRDKNMVLAGLW